ncbi:unnamed protein product [Malus baccata var. baccata]
MICIEDLPDPLLVEILCQLPCSKVVFQCKSVSKRWLRLISDPSFLRRFLCVQRVQQKPILSTLVILAFSDVEGHKTEVFTTSKHPLFQSSNLSLSFLPCFGDKEDREPVVVATYNDLILCCATNRLGGDYYICNPYTKQWVAFPPAPQVHNGEVAPLGVGFMCDPYYNSSSREDGSSTSFDIIQLNTEYRWTIVRIVRNLSDAGYHVEMISTETRGEWRELSLLCSPQQLKHLQSIHTDVEGFISYSAVAHNGKFYWLPTTSECTFELDPFITDSSGDNVAKCRFIDEPDAFFISASNWHLGVCKGCLRMCKVGLGADDPFSVWELKLQEAPEGDWEFEWLADRITQPFDDIPLFSEQEDRSGTVEMLSFHPNNQDIVYFRFDQHIVTGNFREGKLELEIAAKTPFDLGSWREVYTFALPWWPTPVPKL